MKLSSRVLLSFPFYIIIQHPAQKKPVLITWKEMTLHHPFREADIKRANTVTFHISTVILTRINLAETPFSSATLKNLSQITRETTGGKNTSPQSFNSWLQMVSHPLGGLFQRLPSRKAVPLKPSVLKHPRE